MDRASALLHSKVPHLRIHAPAHIYLGRYLHSLGSSREEEGRER